MPDEKYIRVRDKATRHEYSIPERLFNEAAHQVIDKPALGADGLPVPMKPRTTVAKKAAATRKAESGHTEKEN